MPALYRKWRPQKFEEIFGQESIKKTLKNALAAKRITHAYVFAGPRGSGKTTTARILAKSANCQNPKDGEPCDRCFSCQEIKNAQSLDLIEIDAASNRGIEEIKDLREKIKFSPVRAKYKIYVIDEAHQLTLPAFNALLKTLEEPPPHAIFILATTEVHKIPQTIISRCQRFDFRRLSNSDLIKRLSYVADKEKIKIDEEAKKMIAQASFGSARDAESLLDLIISRGLVKISKENVEEILGRTETEKIAKIYQYLVEKNAPAGLLLLGEISEEGKDLFQFISNLIEFLREELLKEPSLSLVSWIKIFSEAQKEMKTATLPVLPLELAVVEICGEDKAEQGGGSDRDKKNKKSENKNKGNIDWNRVISELRPHNHSLCFLLENCQPLEIKDNQITLGVDFKFHKDKLEEAENRKKIEEIIKKVTGNPCKITCQVIKGIQKDKEKKQEDKLIKEIKEVFNG